MPSDKPCARWRIRLEVESDEPGRLTPATTVVELSDAWEPSRDCRPLLECLALDLSSALKAVAAADHVPLAGQVVEAFGDGYERD
jgi:hypothetical protein